MDKKNIKEITKKLKKIRLVISDVDGVLTDGCMYYSQMGEKLKKFHTRDGMAVELLLEREIPVILITKENSSIVKSRAKKIRITKLYSGIKFKEKKLKEICDKFSVTPKEIAYIGDDVNDINIMKMVGHSFCPSDSVFKIMQISNYVCKSKGGEGVLREVTDLILND